MKYLIKFTVSGQSKQASKHTHARVQCSHTNNTAKIDIEKLNDEIDDRMLADRLVVQE